MHHHWQYSWGACSRSKVPIALYGKMLTRLPRLSLSQLRPTLRSTTESTCRRDLRLSHRPHLLLVVRRVAVSSSFMAQWLSHRALSVGTQLALGQTSMSPDTESLPPVTEPPSAPGQRPSPASMAPCQLARHRRPRHHRRPLRRHPRPRRRRPRPRRRLLQPILRHRILLRRGLRR